MTNRTKNREKSPNITTKAKNGEANDLYIGIDIANKKEKANNVGISTNIADVNKRTNNLGIDIESIYKLKSG